MKLLNLERIRRPRIGGYWPTKVFTKKGDKVNVWPSDIDQIVFDGQAGGPTVTPQMGSGHFAEKLTMPGI